MEGLLKVGRGISSLQYRQRRPVLGGGCGHGLHLGTPSKRTGWEGQGTPSGKCRRGQVLLENLETAGPPGPGSGALILMEMPRALLPGAFLLWDRLRLPCSYPPP